MPHPRSAVVNSFSNDFLLYLYDAPQHTVPTRLHIHTISVLATFVTCASVTLCMVRLCFFMFFSLLCN